jgi:hypothetical protein
MLTLYYTPCNEGDHDVCTVKDWWSARLLALPATLYLRCLQARLLGMHSPEQQVAEQAKSAIQSKL